MKKDINKDINDDINDDINEDINEDAVKDGEEKRKSPVAALIVIILLLVALIAVIAFFIVNELFGGDAGSLSLKSTQETADSDENDEEGEESLADNPIDFEALTEQNEDIYAWIEIPNTDVDYPITQAGEDRTDLFYLTHDMYGDYSVAGAIYTEKQNALDFSDPVTVIYGHKMANGTMFASITYYKDEDFFDLNENFYIYTPGHILTYEVFAAFVYEPIHLLNTNDFSDEEEFADYIEFACDASLTGGLARESSTVTTDDTIVVLSTCANSGSDRYLVNGVLINDEATN